MNREGAKRSSSPSTQPVRRQQSAPGRSDALAALVQRAQADSSSLTAGDVRHLQRSIGNQATGSLLAQNSSLQMKLQLGPANDKYEQEADDVARQVVRRMAAPPVQRSDEAEEEIQAKSLADEISPLSSDQPTAAKRAFLAPVAQREEMDDEDSLAQAFPLHGMEGGEVEAGVAETIQRAQGSGSALDPKTRYGMESAFGADFSGVRVHTDSQADTLNRSLNARAFTTGNDIFFRNGEYSPGSSGGKELLAHELTHTVQQGAAKTLQRHFMPIPGYEEEEPQVQRKPVDKISTLTPRIQRVEGDEEVAQLLQQQPLVVNNFIPDTKSGVFDVVLNPQTGAMTVTVRLHLDLVSYNQNAWTQNDANQWIQTLQQNIAQTWNNKVEFHLLRPTLDQPDLIVRPTFRVLAGYTLNDNVARPNAPIMTEVQAQQIPPPNVPLTGGDQVNGSKASAHYDITTTRGPKDDYASKAQEMGFAHPLLNKIQTAAKESNVNSDVFTTQALTGNNNGTGLQGKGVLHVGDNQFMQHHQALMGFITDSEKRSYRELIGDQGIKVNFETKFKGVGDIGARSTVRLNTFIQKWKNLYPRPALRWPLIIEGGSTAKRNKVKDYLENAGLNNRFTLRNARGGVTLKYDSTYQATVQDDVGSQLTAAHEFGHMIGLPDDYVGLHRDVLARMDDYEFEDQESGLDIKMDQDMNRKFQTGAQEKPNMVAKQNAMLDICNRAGVPVPTTFGLKHNTIMGSGNEFLPHHFVTVWDAVCKATDQWTQHTWWKIKMV